MEKNQKKGEPLTKYLKYILAYIVLIGISTLILAIVVSISAVPIVISNDWIGYWGGVIGTTVSGILTLVVLLRTINHNNENLEKQLAYERGLRDKEEKAEFIKYIVELTMDFTIYITKIFNTAEEAYASERKIGLNDEYTDTWNMYHKAFMLLYTNLTARFENENYIDVKMFYDCIEELSNQIRQIDVTYVRRLRDEKDYIKYIKENKKALRGTAKILFDLDIKVKGQLRDFASKNLNDIRMEERTQ